MSDTFKRLVRFKGADGATWYGEALAGHDSVGKTLTVYDGELPWNLTKTDKKVEVAEILCPLAQAPIIYGIGLNYKKHIEEANFPLPEHPTVFTKPPGALAGPYEDIPVNPQCLNMDYEGEMCVIIGKDCKNFTVDDDPAAYVLGFTVGNDVSSRFWQMPGQSGNQHGYAKSFDKFAPIGPVIVSPSNLPHLRRGTPDLQLRTFVNGEERQNTRTSDLLFDIADILQHLSRGTTIKQGTVIMTGTPSGVAAFLQPPNWLKSGDVVEVEIEGLGQIKNRLLWD
ncbi:fumarylacetoacetate hydrolase family protein [Pyrenochaeta sp. DS3sAY3a]|nr:fumarylacetoacetate hydrolase family protein [Pyrenochaeta sp. DS3sAY3a]